MIGLRRVPASEAGRRVGVRMRRQKLLTAADPPRVWSILDEAALRQPVGGPAVMREQLRRLTEVAALPDVPDVVYIEQLAGARCLEKPADADRYLDVINRLSATALNPDHTIGFLTGMINDM